MSNSSARQLFTGLRDASCSFCRQTTPRRRLIVQIMHDCGFGLPAMELRGEVA